jgi:hypothetical protein
MMYLLDFFPSEASIVLKIIYNSGYFASLSHSYTPTGVDPYPISLQLAADNLLTIDVSRSSSIQVYLVVVSNKA